jgi:hypothetical protein
MLSLAFESRRNRVLPATRATSAQSADFSGQIGQIDGMGQIKRTVLRTDKERVS